MTVREQKIHILIKNWNISYDIWNSLDASFQDFLLLELSGIKDLDYYISRLQAVGFSSLPTVLDAGCGIGQWSVALSRLCGAVHAVDLYDERVELAKKLASLNNAGNIQFSIHGVESLPFPNEYFDGVFCYGVFMFTDMKKTIAEFYRILKPGGKLYVNYNAPGWYLHLIIDRGLKRRNFSLVKQAMRMVKNYFVGNLHSAMLRKNTMINLLDDVGFVNYIFGSEGRIKICHKNVKNVPPAYPESLYGRCAVVEVVGEK